MLSLAQWAYTLWDIGGGRTPRKVIDLGDDLLHFSFDGRRVATELSETAVGIYDPATGELRSA